MSALATDQVLSAFVEEVGTDGPITVEGGRTRWGVGGDLRPDARIVRVPSGIREHTPAEMTVRVLAGTPVSELHAALREERQRTALPERGGTVGGAIAVGENDHRMLGRGLVRNALLQVRYVSAEGRLVSGGGPTVKNVSGFDLPRLMVGALGTLGLLAEVILRTNPIPTASALLRCKDADPFAVFDSLYAPSCVLWDGTTTWVQLEGRQEALKTQVRSLGRLGSFAETESWPHLPPYRWSLTPAELPRLGGAQSPFPPGSDIVALVGVGVVFSSVPPPRPSLSGGYRLRYSSRMHPGLDAIHERMKTAFDPTGRLNPGRDPRRR